LKLAAKVIGSLGGVALIDAKMKNMAFGSSGGGMKGGHGGGWQTTGVLVEKAFCESALLGICRLWLFDSEVHVCLALDCSQHCFVLVPHPPLP